MRALIALAVASVLVAGCLGSGNDADSNLDDSAVPQLTTDWVARALTTDEDGKHSHKNWTDHVNMSTPNFRELAHDPLGIPAYGNVTAGAYFCGGSAITDDGRHLTVINSFDTNVAFSVVETTDPAHPRHLGDYLLDYAQTYDVDITPDGMHVVVGANVATEEQPAPQKGTAAVAAPLATPSAGTVTTRLSFRDACTGEVTRGPDQTFAAGPSTILVGIQDPTMPTFEDIVPAPVIGPHSVSTARIDGHVYATASITNLANAASYYYFFEVVDLPTGSKLELLSVVNSGAYGNPAGFNGHLDAEIALHPITGTPIAYLSNWGGGVALLDFSLPQAPRMLGTWADTGPSGGALHSTLSMPDAIDGKHYLLAGQEFIGHPQSGRPTGWIYILDDTDPANVVEVGRWTLPIDTQADWGGVELFSTHYFRVMNDTAFVGMYHGGVWAFELDWDDAEALKAPRTLGVFLPAKSPQDGRDLDWGFANGFYNYAPFVLDLFVFPDNKLVVYDALTGVYSVEWDPTVAVMSPAAWPVDGET